MTVKIHNQVNILSSECVRQKPATLDLQDAIGRSLAMHAAISQNVAVINFLAGQTFDITLIDRTGNSVMHYAACSGNDVIIKKLLDIPGVIVPLQKLNYHGK